MKYFQNLPKLLTTDYKGNYITLTNLLVRVNIIPDLLKNPLLFYSYDIKDSDTPESIAYKYYGSVDQFWLVMFSNQLLDPQWDWPLNSVNLEIYINDKYGSLANAQNQIHHYEEAITITNSSTQNVTTNITIVDANTYTSAIQSTISSNLPDGTVVSIATSVYPVDSYTYEININEAKRNINLIDVKYVPIIEEQFKSLVSK